MSWQRQRAGSEDGEIDEEEGEITDNPQPPVALSLSPSKSRPTVTHSLPHSSQPTAAFHGESNFPPQPPLPNRLSSTSGPNSIHPYPGASHSSSNSNNNIPVPPPRRGSWRGGRGGTSVGGGAFERRPGRGLGHRNTSFGSGPPAFDAPPPARSQSFQSFHRHSSGSIPGLPASNVLPPVAATDPRRATDPRFRGAPGVANTPVSAPHFTESRATSEGRGFTTSSSSAPVSFSSTLADSVSLATPYSSLAEGKPPHVLAAEDAKVVRGLRASSVARNESIGNDVPRDSSVSGPFPPLGGSTEIASFPGGFRDRGPPHRRHTGDFRGHPGGHGSLNRRVSSEYGSGDGPNSEVLPFGRPNEVHQSARQGSQHAVPPSGEPLPVSRGQSTGNQTPPPPFHRGPAPPPTQEQQQPPFHRSHPLPQDPPPGAFPRDGPPQGEVPSFYRDEQSVFSRNQHTHGGDFPPFSQRASDQPPFSSGPPNVEQPLFRGPRQDSYYGPASRDVNSGRFGSPSQRDRPIVNARGVSGGPPPPPPPLGSQGALTSTQHPSLAPGVAPLHRRNDPRLHRDPDAEGRDFADAASASEPLRPNFPPERTGFPAQSERGFRKPPFGQMFPPGGATENSTGSDSFGRSRERNTAAARSPQTSPHTRKPVLSYFQESPAKEIPRLPAIIDAKSGSLSSRIKSVGQHTEARTEEPEPLLTSVLGEDSVDRAEKVVLLLTDQRDKASLERDDKGCSELPKKQTILIALNRMDTKIKLLQKSILDKEEEVEAHIEKEKEDQKRAAKEAKSEAERLEKEHRRRREEEQQADEKAEQEQIEGMIEEGQAGFDADLTISTVTFETDLEAARKVEEARFELECQEQISAATERFDNDVQTTQQELENSIQSISNTQNLISALEEEYKCKMEEGDTAGEEKMDQPDLVNTVLEENRRRAAEAHVSQWAGFPVVSDDDEYGVLENEKDPKEGKRHVRWAEMAQKVTGVGDALYNEPSEAPYFEQNERLHALIGPLVTEQIRYSQRQFDTHWRELAEEYEYRRVVYEAQQLKDGTAQRRRIKSTSVPHRLVGSKPNVPILESTSGHGRSSNNPYRRARRGNEVRTEYEQEQIIAELAAKEALEKRIATGGSELPRQIGQIERSWTATYIQTFSAQRVDLEEQEAELRITGVWTDMEKCIFLDRFMQHPKDFRKIASFLRNKTTTDCVAFYYDSKQTLPYKGALKEHVMRRKRRGGYPIWEATIQAALSVGAVVEAGDSEEKPLIFTLPFDDHTFSTFGLHPLKREVLDLMEIKEQALAEFDADEDADDVSSKSGQPKKRPRDRLFLLDPRQRKFLKPLPQESAHATCLKVDSGKASTADDDHNDSKEGTAKDESGRLTPLRKAPQKWTASEKKIFHDTLESHGRNWSMLSQAVGTKTISQIKNYYYDYKKQKDKNRTTDKDKKVESKTERTESHENSPTPPHIAADQRPGDQTSNEPISDLRKNQPPRYDPQFEAKHIERQMFEVLQQQGQGPYPEQERLVDRRPVESLSDQELWAQLHRQGLLGQQRGHLSDEAARQLLQHHSQSHHQQVLSNLMPWASGGQLPQPVKRAQPINVQEWEQLQAILQIQRQQEQHRHQHQPHVPHNPMANLDPQMLALARLAGLDSSALGMNPQLSRLAHHPAVGSAGSHDDAQMALAQRLLSYSQSAGGGGNSAQGALDLLTQAMSRGGAGRHPNPDRGSDRGTDRY
jgi:hypothetical protein